MMTTPLSDRSIVPRRLRPIVAVVAAAVLLQGCGDDDGSAPSGEVTEAWEGFCVATFTSDVMVMDVFDDPLFTARTGERYLMGNFDDRFGELRVGMFFLGDSGPVDFEVVADGEGNLPVTSNCTDDTSTQQQYAGVFEDVTLFADQALTQEACTLTAGTAVETSGGGFALVDENVNLFSAEPAVHSIQLGGLGEMCNGLTEGFVRLPSVQVFGTFTYLPPIRTFIGPVAGDGASGG